MDKVNNIENASTNYTSDAECAVTIYLKRLDAKSGNHYGVSVPFKWLVPHSPIKAYHPNTKKKLSLLFKMWRVLMWSKEVRSCGK